MATLTATAAIAPARAIHAGPTSVLVKYDVGASLSAGDVIQMFNIPSGAVVTDVALGGGSGACTVDVGDGDDDDRYVAAQSASAALAKTPATLGFGHAYSDDDTIDITVDAVSVPTATGQFILKVDYLVGQ